MREISIRKNAIESAAMYIKMNNHYMKNNSLSYIHDRIQDHVDYVITKAKQNWQLTYVSSGGWTVMFSPEDERYGTIEVLVDTQVSQETDYEYIKLKEKQ